MTLLLAAFLAIGFGSAAGAYPPSGAVLSVSASDVPPGATFEATVGGCTPGESVVFSFIGNDSATVVCTADGTATTTFVAPSTPGRYDVTAVLDDGTVLTVSITVSAVTTTTTAAGSGSGSVPGSLPTTGSDATSSTLFAAGGAVAFGAVFLLVARMRRRDQPAAA